MFYYFGMFDGTLRPMAWDGHVGRLSEQHTARGPKHLVGMMKARSQESICIGFEKLPCESVGPVRQGIGFDYVSQHAGRCRNAAASMSQHDVAMMLPKMT